MSTGWSSLGLGDKFGLITGIGSTLTGMIADRAAADTQRYQLKSQALNLEHQQDMAKLNKRMLESQAQHIGKAYNKQIAIRTMKAGQAISSSKASFAARGIQMGVGSTANVFASAEILKEIDKINMSMIMNENNVLKVENLIDKLDSFSFNSKEVEQLLFDLDIEDLDFSKVDYFGELIAKKIKLKRIRSQEYFALVLPGICVSGILESQKFKLPGNHVPFRTLTLSKPNVSQVLSVTDSEGNEYYEVDALSQDTVFRGFENPTETLTGIKSILGVIAAPYRFVSKTDLRTRTTSIQFGGGSASTLNDDAVPDPSDLTLPLYGKKTMSRFL